MSLKEENFAVFYSSDTLVSPPQGMVNFRRKWWKAMAGPGENIQQGPQAASQVDKLQLSQLTVPPGHHVFANRFILHPQHDQNWDQDSTLGSDT
jgi:hypothetical protein